MSFAPMRCPSGPRPRHVGSFLLIALAWVPVLLGCQANPWQQLRSRDGNYSVLLPGAPTTEQRQTGGPDTVTVHLVTVQRAQQTYAVAYTDYPEQVISRRQPEAVLDRAVEGALGDAGKLVSAGPHTLNGHTGRNVEATLAEGVSFAARFYLVGSRLYQTSVLALPGGRRSEDQARFLDSFKLEQGTAPP